MRPLLSRVVVLALFCGFAAAQDKPVEELFIPIMINGMVDDDLHFQTLFRFVELSGTTASPAVSIEMDAFDNEGKTMHPDKFSGPPPLPAPDSTIRWNLASSGSAHSGTKGFVQAYDPAPGVIDGWVRIRSSGPGKLHVNAEIAVVHAVPVGCPPLICSRPSYQYESDALVQAVKPAKAFRVPTVVTPERQAAFSIVNPSSDQEAFVSLLFYDTSGVRLGRVGVHIPPLNRMSRFAAEFAQIPPVVVGLPEIWALPERYYGSVLITSDIPIVVGAIQVLMPEGKLVASSVAAVN